MQHRRGGEGGSSGVRWERGEGKAVRAGSVSRVHLLPVVSVRSFCSAVL